MFGRYLLISLIFLLSLSESPTARAGDAAMIELEILGDPGVGFAGDCRLTTGKLPEKRYRINGTAPAKYWLPGDAARCSFAKNAGSMGRLVARLTRRGVIEVEQTSPPPFRWLTLSSTGPWGDAQGLASAARPLWQ
ncbi:hypothetical protein [Sneathiella sp.]|jgi:hypothetical protein|uniref:hypothetical protein n=1 Tax=Sneathiella sp. TaxID=1964365 RepID=UPI0025E1769D|nr:hypothetical protein [Sneathiella sp.]|tara:strand:- start:18 stop:425 length:408 start_codon:yes stop_codon:yes gene_type:complete